MSLGGARGEGIPRDTSRAPRNYFIQNQPGSCMVIETKINNNSILFYKIT